MKETSITVPGVPPSVNHYKKPRRGGRGFYVTKEAERFKEAIAYLGDRNWAGKNSASFLVWVDVYLGYRGKLDLDNSGKVILDGLVDGRIIRSDARVMGITLRKFRDWADPRTEIRIQAES